MFGEERFKKLLLDTGSSSAKEVKQAVLDKMEEYETSDDITMLIIKKTG